MVTKAAIVIRIEVTKEAAKVIARVLEAFEALRIMRMKGISEAAVSSAKAIPVAARCRTRTTATVASEDRRAEGKTTAMINVEAPAAIQDIAAAKITVHAITVTGVRA
jgi:hypothetical protein